MIALLPMAVGACASRAEMARLQQQVVDLRKQLEAEKQRQAGAEERLKRAKEHARKKGIGAH